MMKPAFVFACIAAATLPLVSACSERAEGRPSMLSAAAQSAPQPETRLTVPAGLVATNIATVPGARMMVLGPDGAVYISQPAANQITRLVIGADGAVQSQTVAVKELNRPHGMAFHDGSLYIANTDGVVRTKLGPDGTATSTLVYVNHYSKGGGHWTRSILFGPDGGMYVSIGSSCNLCVEKDSDRAVVMRYDADGSHGHVYSRGLRNAVGLAVEPTTHAIWVTQNERDNLTPDHQNLPPEEINILRDGGDYGWPYCYGDRIPNPEYHDATRCARTLPPALEMQAHSAPLGITFLTNATQLPSDMRGDALVAFHGSWNRTTPTGAKVVRIHVRDGKPVSYDDFITGWQRPDGSRWGRPVDLLVLRDGSLLISDDASGEIVRVAKR